MQLRVARVCLAAASLMIVEAFAQTVIVQGLQLPQRIIATQSGFLLITEGGTATPHTGRLSLVDLHGTRRSLIEGLPAAPGHGVMAFGPTGLALRGRVLYLLLGQGDLLTGPPFVINPDGPSSPIFNCVLRVEFSADIDAIQSPFRMEELDGWTLHDGSDLQLRNVTGERATVHLLTRFAASFRNILGGPASYRYTDPYTAWLDSAGTSLYIVDAGAETLVRVETTTGHSRVLTRFQPHQRATPEGLQYVDNVPTSGCAIGETIYLSFLTGSPFPQGEASVTSWTPQNGSWYAPIPFVRGLTMVNDLVCLRGSTPAVPRLATIEISTDSAIRLNPPTGRVQLFEGSQRRVVAENLPLPTGAVEDPLTGDLFVLTLTGSIFRFPLR